MGREAALTITAYTKLKNKEKIQLDFTDVFSVGPSQLDEFSEMLEGFYGKDKVECLTTENLSVNESLKIIRTQAVKKKVK